MLECGDGCFVRKGVGYNEKLCECRLRLLCEWKKQYQRKTSERETTYKKELKTRVNNGQFQSLAKESEGKEGGGRGSDGKRMTVIEET